MPLPLVLGWLRTVLVDSLVLLGMSVSDIIWDVNGHIHEACVGAVSPKYVLSMDLAKCFDHLDLLALEAVCRKVGFLAGVVAIQNYSRLVRLLFVDGQP